MLDETGRRDNAEMYNILCRDIFNKHPPTVKYNAPILKALPGCLYGLGSHGMRLSTMILGILSEALGVPENSDDYLPQHFSRFTGLSSHIRLCKYPSKQARKGIEESEELLNLQGHTDCGFLTLLFTIVGGLQIYLTKDVLPLTGYEEGWYWVEPLPGHAIINVGDAMVAFSGGIFKSVLHRVTAPPSSQKGLIKRC